MADLTGKTAVVLVENIYNEFEFWYPRYRLQEAGAKVLVAGPEKGKTYKSKVGLEAVADVAFADIDPTAVDVLVIPGGYAPDIMRRHQACLDLVRSVDAAGKLVAFICHAGWVPISAGIVKGRKLTSFSAIKDDLINAGAIWKDAPVVVDGNFVTSRVPDDLPEFMAAVIRAAR